MQHADRAWDARTLQKKAKANVRIIAALGGKSHDPARPQPLASLFVLLLSNQNNKHNLIKKEKKACSSGSSPVSLSLSLC